MNADAHDEPMPVSAWCTAARPILERLTPPSSSARAVPVLGLAGAPGAGKTTLARRWAAAEPGRIVLSLDDFYADPATRQRLARTVHPWLARRGVPGTHDLDRLLATIERLAAGRPAEWPRFDKTRDRAVDPGYRHRWGRPRAILVEGWCLGADRLPDWPGLPEPWRRHVEAALHGPLARLNRRIERLVFLRAPDRRVVGAWRLEAERHRSNRPAARRDVATLLEPMWPLIQEMIQRPPPGTEVVALDPHRRPARQSTNRR